MNFLIIPLQYLIFHLLFRITIFLIKAAVYAIIFLPQLFTAYLLCKILIREDEPLGVWIICILLIAFIIYMLIGMLKGTINYLKRTGNWLWLPIFIALVGYTCIFPSWVMFGAMQKIMSMISQGRAPELTWLGSIAMSAFIYNRYRFLSP